MKENKKSYARDFKMKAVLLTFEKGTIEQVAKNLNISSRSLYHWRKNYIIYGEEILLGKGKIHLNGEEKKIYELEQKISKLNIEFEITKNAAKYILNGKQTTFQFIADNENRYSSYLLCKTLAINLGSYNKWKNEYTSEKQKWTMLLKEEIKTAFFFSKKRYGCRRIAIELQKKGYKLSHSTVLRYMRELGLHVSVKKGAKYK